MHKIKLSRRRRRRDWLIYAQVKHPASGYVQGMNDLLAVFLVVLVDEVSEGDHVDVATLSDDVLDDVAADAYGLLNGVLESLDDHYVHRQPVYKGRSRRSTGS